MPVTVVVLAAGQGKRMHSDLPKVLQPLAGRPLLAHVLSTARTLDPAAIHVVYGHGGERVREAFSDGDLHWVLQAEQLGTGHAVSQALPSIPNDHRVVVLCGDVPLVRAETLKQLVGVAEQELALVTAVVASPAGYGRVIRDGCGDVQRIVEEKDATDEERAITEINTGLLCLSAEALRECLGKVTNANAQGEYYLTDVIGLAVERGIRVRPVVADATEVLGINDRMQLAVAERSLQRRIADDLLRRGVTLADPARIDVRGELTVGRDVFIDVGAVFEGHVRLGDRVRIGPHTLIADAELGDDSIVHSHTVIVDAVAGPGCEIGPFARLRPGAALARHVKVGNFVEIKKSRVEEGSKINHLTYVGDASIGADVNVGAGTITCNYDGVNKHRTVIGAGAFIGSGVMLIAPVEVGAGATIGAGSAIGRDAPPGKLTLERSKQVTVDGWQRPKKQGPNKTDK